MADPESAPKRAPRAMRLDEIFALATRLESRGVTKLSDQPEQQADLRLAAKVLRAMAKSFNRGDTVTLDGD